MFFFQWIALRLGGAFGLDDKVFLFLVETIRFYLALRDVQHYLTLRTLPTTILTLMPSGVAADCSISTRYLPSMIFAH